MNRSSEIDKSPFLAIITGMQNIALILITAAFILLSHYLAVFPHEYAHSFTAWFLGYKSNPFALNYGGTSLSNLLLLSNIDQNVDNKMIYASGHPAHVALIAFAGPGMNALLFFLSFCLLRNSEMKQQPFVLYFVFLFNLMNLGNIYDYVPIRTFATGGKMCDVLDIEKGLNISPWSIYFIVGYLVAFLIWQFFTKTMIRAYVDLKITSTFLQASLMTVCVIILFGYFGAPGFSHGEISYFISATSFIAIPGITVILWPTRAWVKRQVKLYKLVKSKT